ncbi:MAG: hypothetical protein KGK03_01500 [Candidatus Omnitrophica bacterium]|nr:hypothetical protein [Candidatus Omnitrophota bacterium]MDE2221725.1 hypothetical protein [Candidatus Omnitrophota bacterium]
MFWTIKNFSLALILCLCTAAADALAGNLIYNTNYPAPVGSYNKLTLSAPPSAPDCTSATNKGVVYQNGSDLILCASNGASHVSVPYNETCFNRYCSSTDASCNSKFTTGSPNPCPTGFALASINGASNNYDTFTSNGTNIYSIVCCTSGSTVKP